MAYIVPLDQPLSETQSKLIAQVGSMKNLTDLPFLRKFKIKKEDGISTFDYLLKVLRAMGIDPQLLLVAFLNDIFKTEKLVELMLRATAHLATAAKVNLDGNATLSFTITGDPLTDKQKKELTKINYSYLINHVFIKSAFTTVVDVMKTRIIKELMILIFGRPKKPEAASGPNGLTYSDNRLNELIDESTCGGDYIFSISSPTNQTNEDLEYNRIQKMEQVKNGNLTFQVTCQGVNISLPDDPTYLFSDVPFGGSPLSTTEAMTNVFNFVGNQIQKGTTGESSQSNAQSGAKSFTQKFLETLMSSITCLLSPFFVGIIDAVPGVDQASLDQDAWNMLTNGLLKNVFNDLNGQPMYYGFDPSDYFPASSCDIYSNYNKNNLSASQKKKVTLMTILCNLILNMAIGFILAYVLEKVKKMIKKYMAKKAQERMERKMQKIKAKQANSPYGVATQNVSNSKKQVQLMVNIAPVLQYSANVFQTPNIT